MSYYTASTLLGSKSHTTMYHDTIIVLELSFRYRKSYIILWLPFQNLDTCIQTLQYANDLEYVLHVRFTLYCSFGYSKPTSQPSININCISSYLLFFIAFVLRVDPTLICLYISSFYFKQNFVVYEINFEYLIGFSVFSNISSNWS